MATITWERIRHGIGVTAPARDNGLRRVGLRLAAQTVGLLLVMLLALEVVVYLKTQQEGAAALVRTLKNRANQPDPTICVAYHPQDCLPGFGALGRRARQPRGEQGRSPLPPQGSFGPAANLDLNPSDASSVFAVSSLRIVHHEGALGAHLLDKQAVRRALRTKVAQCCSVQQYKGQDYRVYTKPLLTKGKALVAVQTSISQSQYEGTLNSLVQTLFVATLLGLAGSGAISVLLVGRALQPVRSAIQRQRDFVADAAHELRTPLAIQRTVGEVGLGEQAEEDQGATIEQMLAENRHLTRLVDDLSLLARTDSQAVTIERRPVELSPLVADTVAELGPLAEEQGVTLTAEVAENMRVLGDIVRLRQLLLILVDNALKHTPAGGTIRVRLDSNAGRVRLQVIDSGPGILPADLARIFDRFYRSDRARTGEGSGLGLAIGKWIAEAHGGQIQAGNTAPHGAVFTVTLPLVRGA